MRDFPTDFNEQIANSGFLLISIILYQFLLNPDLFN